MAVIAATALDRLTLATRIAGSAAAVDQGRAYSFATEQIALRRVADLVARDPAKLTLAGNWLGRDFVLPLPGGQGTDPKGVGVGKAGGRQGNSRWSVAH